MIDSSGSFAAMASLQTNAAVISVSASYLSDNATYVEVVRRASIGGWRIAIGTGVLWARKSVKCGRAMPLVCLFRSENSRRQRMSPAVPHLAVHMGGRTLQHAKPVRLGCHVERITTGRLGVTQQKAVHGAGAPRREAAPHARHR